MRTFSLTRVGAVWLVVLLVLAGGRMALAATPPEIIARGKKATALVRANEDEGSAFCIGQEGLFVTNYHVISDAGKAPITLTLNPGEKDQTVVPAEVLRVDEEADLALLLAKTRLPLTVLELGNVDDLFETMQVAVFGFPFGTELALGNNQVPNVSITLGRITSLRKLQGELETIQLDAAINPGNSGGPVINEKGQAVGVVVATIEGAAGVHFAIPISHLLPLLTAPLVEFKPEPLAQEKLGVQNEFYVELKPFRNVPLEPHYGVQMTIGSGRRPQVVAGTALGNGMYRVRAVPLPTGTGRILPRTLPYQIRVLDGTRVLVTVTGNFGVQGINQSEPVVPPVSPIRPAAPVQPATPGTATPGTAAPARADDWLGTTGQGSSQGGALKVEESGKNLLGPPRTVVDAVVRSVQVEAGSVSPSMAWSSDGKLLYILEESGRLREIAVPEFREVKSVNLGQQAKYLSLSKLGLVVGLPLVQEVWLLDYSSLAILRRIALAEMTGLTSAPTLELAYATRGRSMDGTLAILDLKAGRVAGEATASEVRQAQGDNVERVRGTVPLTSFEMPSASPDGAYLFVQSFEGMHRFKIQGSDLIYEEAGPRLGGNPRAILFSPDSNYVCLPCGGGNNIGETDRSPYTTFVFRVTNLAQPVVRVSSGAYPQYLAFDRMGKRILTQNRESELLTFTPNGMLQKAYKLSSQRERMEDVKQILAHPSAGFILVLTGDRISSMRNAPKGNLYYVELPPNPA